ncbi:MAG: putative ABC transporter permease [Lachnospiraceae bacterium]|nr:putative ABC transporter permease [Lachnospiraceae bacterium]
MVEIWMEEIHKLDPYHFFSLFAVYSMMGWLVESIYMSICNRRVTNRGFAKGPFCPIYGVGCIGGYLVFAPFKGKYVFVYIFGSLVATTFEFIVGKIMIKSLGELWWDYKEKPFNYQGIICLESTLAWGIYALVVVHFLYDFTYNLVDMVDRRLGILLLIVIYFLVFIDYLMQFSQIFGWPKVLGGQGLKETPDISRATMVNHPDAANKAKEPEAEKTPEAAQTPETFKAPVTTEATEDQSNQT